MTSARRRARAGLTAMPSSPGRGRAGAIVNGIPWELTTAGTASEFWADRHAVAAFRERFDLPEPHPTFWTSPRALRDHCADAWLVANGFDNGWARPNWHKASEFDVPPATGSRVQARRGA